MESSNLHPPFRRTSKVLEFLRIPNKIYLRENDDPLKEKLIHGTGFSSSHNKIYGNLIKTLAERKEGKSERKQPERRHTPLLLNPISREVPALDLKETY